MPKQLPHHVSSQESQNPHSPRSARTQKCETNPIYPHSHPAAHRPPRFCETNPISSGQQPTAKGQQLFLQNEPNLPYCHPPHDPITRNEPNLPCQLRAATVYAKRTQFTAPPPAQTYFTERAPFLSHIFTALKGDRRKFITLKGIIRPLCVWGGG